MMGQTDSGRTPGGFVDTAPVTVQAQAMSITDFQHVLIIHLVRLHSTVGNLKYTCSELEFSSA